jgi:ribosomal protein L12E/L44/L45/RPP1/RPP2
MYSNVIILTIFVFALLIAIVEIPNILENVLAQQQLEYSQQVSSSSSSSSSSSDSGRTSIEDEEEEDEEEEEESRSSADRIPNDGVLRR